MKNRSRLESHRGTQDEFEILCNTLAGLAVEQAVESFVEGLAVEIEAVDLLLSLIHI